MHTRPHSVTLTAKRESFAFSRTAARSTEPEVFTFERVPAQATAVRSYVPIRPKKRCTRVMYPAKVRMHLPPPEKSQAKRWLVILCLVVLWQIYTEEPCAEAPPGCAEAPPGCAEAPPGSAEASGSQGLRFQPAEEHLSAGSELLSATPTSCEDNGSPSEQLAPNTCPQPGQEPDTSRSFEQSAGKGYVVALLVYHRLGSDS